MNFLNFILAWKKLYIILVLVFGNFKVLGRIIHDYQSTIVVGKKIGRSWVQIVEEFTFQASKFRLYSVDSGDLKGLKIL